MRHDILRDELLKGALDILDLLDDPPGLVVVKVREIDLGQVRCIFWSAASQFRSIARGAAALPDTDSSG